MDDEERATHSLKAVHVTGNESYEDGHGGVTSVQWSKTSGSMAHILTVQIYKGDDLHSEHPFINVLGVVYE